MNEIIINKKEECVHRIHMSLLTTKVNRGITPEWGKVVKSEIKLHLPFQVSDLVYKFKMIYLSY